MSDAGGAGGSASPPIRFVSALHAANATDDDDSATPVGFQDTPDDWHTTKRRQRGVHTALADAPTQPDSEATVPQSLATQGDGTSAARSDYAPSFVYAAASLSGDSMGSEQRMEEEIDEEETQIMISSMSQEPSRLRPAAHRIEEEALDSSRLQDTEAMSMRQGTSVVLGEENSDAESDLSDDMLEQDGDINGLSSLAKTFQQSEAELKALIQPKKPVPVYKPRGPFQFSPPPSVVGGSQDDSSGAETEVDEEPATTDVNGTMAKKDEAAHKEEQPPDIINVGIKTDPPSSMRLGKRSVSETGVLSATDEPPPRRMSLDRAVSCSEVDASPERSKRPRISLSSTPNRKPPLPRQNFSRSESPVLPTPSVVEPSETHVLPVDESSSTQVLEDQSRAETSVEIMLPPPPTATKPPVFPKPRATKKAPRKRKSSSQSAVMESELQDEDEEPSRKKHASPPTTMDTSQPTVRIMFTGLDGTILELRDQVKQVADAVQEDEDVKSVTHLIAPKNQLKRTVKLLRGISCCDHILDERWLDESARVGACVDEKVHCLKDKAAEAKWHFSLYNTMYNVPKAERRRLFQGLRFFITNHKSILPPVKDLVKIVECAGGHAEIKGSAGTEDIVITSDAAMALASTKKAIAQANPDRIFTPEFILGGILQQRVDLETHRISNTADQASQSTKKRGKR